MIPHTPTAGLPDPSPDALLHSGLLVEAIRAAAQAAGGCLGFDRFMHLALYASGLGYYSAGSRKLGADGDFVTAPELSPLFARCLAAQCAEVLEQLPDGELLEAGGGSGILAARLLLALKDLGAAPRRYCLLEPSAELRHRQRETLEAQAPRLLERVEWLDGLPPRPWRGVLIANEVLDAMPAKRFRIGPGGQILELGARAQGEGFAWCTLPAEGDLEQTVGRIGAALGAPLAEGYESECNPAAEAWVRELGIFLEAGLALLIDYGFPRREYYHPDRSRGTLMCHYRHQAHGDPFLWPGLQDITAHLDFTALAQAGQAGGLDLAGYTSQAHFLINTGLLEELRAARADDPMQQTALAQQVGVLTSPAEMGELFKVMALSKGLSRTPGGFARGDRRGRL